MRQGFHRLASLLFVCFAMRGVLCCRPDLARAAGVNDVLELRMEGPKGRGGACRQAY